MKRALLLAICLIFGALGAHAQTATTTITIVAPASLGTVTPTPTKFYQNTAAPISFASSTGGFSSSCTATVGTAALPVTYDAVKFTLSGNLTAAMTAPVPGTSVTIAITCTPSPLTMMSPVALPNAKVGAAYSASLQTVTGLSGGVPPYTWTVNSGSLPPGLTLSSSGVVSGVASGVGSFSFNFTVTDSSGLAVLVRRGKVQV